MSVFFLKSNTVTKNKAIILKIIIIADSFCCFYLYNVQIYLFIYLS